MGNMLTPDQPIVQQGKLLNLVMQCDSSHMNHKQFLVLQAFDYGAVLEEIRSEGLLKSEEVYKRLYEVLLERNIVEPIESNILNVGELGRPSKALQEHYRQKLNANSSLIKILAQELERSHFTFNGPEGELHLLTVGTGEVLGHVMISLDEGSGLYADLTLDIIGPNGSDFPEHFEDMIVEKLLTFLQGNHPGLTVGMNARVRRSELAVATGDFHARC